MSVKVGVAEAKITPVPEDFILIGPMVRGTGVHDDLFARTIVLTHNENVFVIITLDLLGLDIETTSKIRNDIQRRMNISAEKIMINCSHTHSAPITVPWHIAGLEEFKCSQWREELIFKIVNLVEVSKSNPIDCNIKFGRSDVQVGMNRRLQTNEGISMKPNSDGTVIPWVDALFFEDMKGKLVAILFSHSAHPVNIHSTSTMISADYPGFAVSEIKKILDDNVLVMFAQGCAGNINSQPLRGGLDSAKEAGKSLGLAVIRAMDSSRSILIESLKSANSTLKLFFQNPPSVESCDNVLRKWKERAAQIDSGKIKADLYTVYTKPVISSLEDLKKIALSEKKKELEFEIQCCVFSSELCIVGMMHEVFAEYHLYIKEISPFKNTMVFAYTNGCESYIPCEKDFELGGYEAGKPLDICSSLSYTRLLLDTNVERVIKKGLQDILNKMFDKQSRTV